MRLIRRLKWVVPAFIFLIIALAFYEAHTSALQARVFSSLAARLSYTVGSGPSSQIVFPQSGPFNQARGYTELPGFSGRLVNGRFHIAAQSRFSAELDRMTRWE